MSTFRNPVGRQSAKVYWRRRAVVLLGLVAVLVVVLLIVFRPGSGQAAPSAGRTPSPTDTGAPQTPGATDAPPASDAPDDGAATDGAATDDPAGAGGDAAGEEATGDDAGGGDASADAPPAVIPTEAATAQGAACKAANLSVTAVTDKSDYAAGEQPRLSLTLENTGSKPCVINAGTAKQVFTITSGKEVYWVSTDCQSDLVDTEITLAPHRPVSSSAPIVWDRTRSSASTCGTPREAVPAGGASYWLNVTVDGTPSLSGAQFLLY